MFIQFNEIVLRITARYLGEQFQFRNIENFPGFKIAIEGCSVDWSHIHLPSQENQNKPNQISSEEASGHSSTTDKEVKTIEELDEDVHMLCTRADALQVMWLITG